MLKKLSDAPTRFACACYALFPNAIQEEFGRGGLLWTTLESYSLHIVRGQAAGEAIIVRLAILGSGHTYQDFLDRWRSFDSKCTSFGPFKVEDDEEAVAECMRVANDFPAVPAGSTGWFRVLTREEERANG